MHIEQIYTGCLAQGAYYITSNNEAVVIDPLREVQPYLDRANRDGVTIKYILETHFHADFVSGHLDLAKRPVLRSYMAPMPILFRCPDRKDGQELMVGDVTLKVIHTWPHHGKHLLPVNG